MVKITAEAVHRILGDCMWTDAELVAADLDDNGVPVGAVRVEGVVHTFAFNGAKLECHREAVKALLADLHPNFRKEVGGGWSFINLPFRGEEQEQWGEQRDGEAIMCLGAALGYVEIAPRVMWPMLPGGVPYLAVVDGAAATQEQAADAVND